MAWEQGGQGVEHHQVQLLLVMQGFQASDQGEPLGIGGTSAPERATEELDVLPQGEVPTAGVPVGGGFFGDNEGAARCNRPARQQSAPSEARQQVGQKSRFARFGRADQGRDLARRQVAIPEPGQAGLFGAGQLTWPKWLTSLPIH
jgi:hypothetical protein